jgi:hypothetical protein
MVALDYVDTDMIQGATAAELEGLFDKVDASAAARRMIAAAVARLGEGAAGGLGVADEDEGPS